MNPPETVEIHSRARHHQRHRGERGSGRPAATSTRRPPERPAARPRRAPASNVQAARAGPGRGFPPPARSNGRRSSHRGRACPAGPARSPIPVSARQSPAAPARWRSRHWPPRAGRSRPVSAPHPRVAAPGPARPDTPVRARRDCRWAAPPIRPRAPHPAPRRGPRHTQQHRRDKSDHPHPPLKPRDRAMNVQTPGRGVWPCNRIARSELRSRQTCNSSRTPTHESMTSGIQHRGASGCFMEHTPDQKCHRGCDRIQNPVRRV